MGMGTTPTRRTRRGRAPMAEINVTPLVDVMLVLLIIFMVTAPLLSAGVPLDLPDSKANALEHEQKEVSLSITTDGIVYLGEDAVAPGTLGARLAAIPRDAQGKPPLILFRADRSLTHGQVMEVLGELNHAGFNSVSFVTGQQAAVPVTPGSEAGQ
ncbi:MAG: ExbD/TolR family protein [Novosphingobium sp.]